MPADRTRRLLAVTATLALIAWAPSPGEPNRASFPTTEGPAAAAGDGADGLGPWTQVARTSPAGRFNHAVAHDPVRGETVLFSGCCGPGGSHADTWVWDGATWTHRHPSTSPPPREGATMVFDGARGEVVLFGGRICEGEAGCRDVNETWTWDGITWTREQPVTSPPPRILASMAYDAAREEVVLFGGRDSASPLPGHLSNHGDTWTWDGTDWTRRGTALPGIAADPAAPTPRLGTGMAYDAAREEVVLFGGGGFLAGGDTWTWNGTFWTRRNPATSPPGRLQFGMAYDAAREEVVVFGGGSADTWTWDGSDWTQRDPAVAPPARNGNTLAYEDARGEVVLFGGTQGSAYKDDDTWIWDGTTWRQVPRTVPPPREGAAAAHDSVRGRVVLFGGRGDGHLDDTWTWDGTAWTRHQPAATPPARMWAGAAFDPDRGETVLFGGHVCDPQCRPLGDTWVFDGQDWTERTAPDGPAARYGASLAHHAASGRVLLFGGASDTDGDGQPEFAGDTWAWDGRRWEPLAPASAPPGRTLAAMAPHDGTGELVLFGGLTCPNDFDCTVADTWTWDGTTWTQRTSEVAPARRRSHSMAPAAAAGGIVLTGGMPCTDDAEGSTTCSFGADDTWLWNGTGWVRTDPGSPEPWARGPGRHGWRMDAAMAPTPDGRVMLFGGSRSGQLTNDAHVTAGGPPPG